MNLHVCDRDELEADTDVLDAVTDIVADSHLLEAQAIAADRFVYGVVDDEPVSFASLKKYKGWKGIEVYYLVVDQDAQGQGYGGATFDQALDEAELMAQERGYDHVYMDVWDDTTDTYQDVKAEISENERFFSDHFVPEYCDSMSIPLEEVVVENRPMKYLAESRGFSERESSGSFRKTEYVRSVT